MKKTSENNNDKNINDKNRNDKDNKGKRANVFLIVTAVVLSVLVTFLLIYEAVNVKNKSIDRLLYEKAAYLKLFVEDTEEGPDIDSIIEKIEISYPTSASDFCFVSLNGELIFIRDADLTRNEAGKNADTVLGITDKGSRIEGGYVTNADFSGRDFRVVRMFEETTEGELSVGIAISEATLMSSGDFDIQIEHIAVYMLLLSISFIVSVIFLAHKENEMKRYEAILKQKLEDNWVLIGKLGERVESKAEDHENAQYGFTTKDVAKQVLESLDEKQREGSRRIDIRLLECNQTNIVRYTVVLERMKTERMICCLWDDDMFSVIMLNTSDTAVNNFVKQFLLQYQSIFRKDAKDVKITVGEAVL